MDLLTVRNFSYDTALLRVQNDILKSIDNEQCVVLLLLDLSAAFDTVDQKILLYRLRSRFGLKGKALAWLQSYLSTDRFHAGSSDWFTSSVRTLRFGVPQESVLGRSYLLYTTPLGDIIRWHIWYGIPSICWWYSTVHLTFSCDDSVDLTTIQFPGLRAALSISLTGWLLKNWRKEVLILYSRFRLPPRLPSTWEMISSSLQIRRVISASFSIIPKRYLFISTK